jgi:hypothetical protein
MPDLNENALLKMTPNRRWAARMNHAWHECKSERPADARFYTDYMPVLETPDPDRPGLVKRETRPAFGRIQVWRPGRPTAIAKGMSTETSDGQDWHGFSEVLKKSTDYEECKAAVVALFGRFKGVKLLTAEELTALRKVEESAKAKKKTAKG